MERHSFATIGSDRCREGLFHDWLAQKGKLGGQHKVPRLSNTREYIETMLALNDSIPSEE